jgi:hypothetical protein
VRACTIACAIQALANLSKDTAKRRKELLAECAAKDAGLQKDLDMLDKVRLRFCIFFSLAFLRFLASFARATFQLTFADADASACAGYWKRCWCWCWC